jgi:hypothetical protein
MLVAASTVDGGLPVSLAVAVVASVASAPADASDETDGFNAASVSCVGGYPVGPVSLLEAHATRRVAATGRKGFFIGLAFFVDLGSGFENRSASPREALAQLPRRSGRTSRGSRLAVIESRRRRESPPA